MLFSMGRIHRATHERFAQKPIHKSVIDMTPLGRLTNTSDDIIRVCYYDKTGKRTPFDELVAPGDVFDLSMPVEGKVSFEVASPEGTGGA